MANTLKARNTTNVATSTVSGNPLSFPGDLSFLLDVPWLADTVVAEAADDVVKETEGAVVVVVDGAVAVVGRVEVVGIVVVIA